MTIESHTLDTQIWVLLQMLYWEDNEVFSIAKSLEDEDKKIMLISLYNRYQSMLENGVKLTTNLKVINSGLEEVIDKIQAEEINFNF